MVTMPFQMLQQFNQNNQASVARDEAASQNMLMQMFATEASRQAPYSSYPVDIAKQNNASNNALNNSMTMAGVNEGISRRKARMKAQAPEAIAKKVKQYADMYGEDYNFLMQLFEVESRFDPNAVSETGATGLGQFTRGTGAQYGLVGEGFDHRTDIDKNIVATIMYLKDNRKALEKKFKPEEITPKMLYLAHNQGAGGATALFKAAPNAPLYGTVKPLNAAVNRGTANMTVTDFINEHGSPFEAGMARRFKGKKEKNPEDALLAAAAAYRQPDNSEEN